MYAIPTARAGKPRPYKNLAFLISPKHEYLMSCLVKLAIGRYAIHIGATQLEKSPMFCMSFISKKSSKKLPTP